MDTDGTATFDSTTLPLSSPFLGETGYHEVFAIGDNTGNYTVSYTPLVRGDYIVTVKKPAVWETQLVQTVVETTGEDLSGELCCFVVFCALPSVYGMPQLLYTSFEDDTGAAHTITLRSVSHNNYVLLPLPHMSE